MVDQLDQQTIGVMEIKGTRAVAMSFRLGCQRDTEFPKPGRPLINVVGTAYDKTDMMNGLNRPWLLSGWQLVESQVIFTGCEIGVLGIGHPLEGHSQNLRIEFEGFSNVLYIQSDVTNAQNR